MNTDPLITEIIETCIQIEKRAVSLYRKFSEDAENPDLREFWKGMSDEERTHVEHWSYLLSLAKQGVIPQIFESLQRVKDQIEDVNERIDRLMEEGQRPVDTTSAFAIACHVEFYMLNKEFAYILHFMRSLLEERGEEDTYSAHLARFFEGLERFSNSPELKLLGETIYRVFLENRELQLQSHTDPLTDLLNKRGFFQAVLPLAHLARRKDFSTAVMMIDIDSLKEVNDTHGHTAGDDVLKLTAALLSEITRRSDLVARWGGDEFLVYLSEVDDAHLLEVGEKIRRRIEEESSKLHPVSVSIGISHTRLDDDPDRKIRSLIEKADYCMYQAKQYRNRVVIMHEQKAHLQ